MKYPPFSFCPLVLRPRDFRQPAVAELVQDNAGGSRTQNFEARLEHRTFDNDALRELNNTIKRQLSLLAANTLTLSSRPLRKPF